jgi:hypothetical protein
MLVLATLALAACDRPNDARMPSVAPAAVTAATDTAVPPPLPVRTDVNAAEAEATMKSIAAATPAQPGKDGADQGLYVAAQEAAAQAPETAAADEAKKRVLEGGTSGDRGADRASVPDNPQAAELPKSEEVAGMPKPGQVNDHSIDGPQRTGGPDARQ